MKVHKTIFSPLRKTSGSRPLLDVFFFYVLLYSYAKVYEILLFQAQQPNLIKLTGVVE